MELQNPLDNWYALFVKTGQEEKVKDRVIYRFGDDLRVMVPKRKLRERRAGSWYFRTRPLFPGYVLLHGRVDQDAMAKLRDIPGLLTLLRSGATPSRIEHHEMEILSRLICNGEEIGFSEIIVENQNIRVVDGPLVSMEGYIVGVDYRKNRARVQLTFLGEPRTIDLGISVIRLVE